MAAYTKVNLKTDVEDMAPKFGMSPDVEAHFAARDLGLERSGMSYQRLAPGVRSPFGHKHAEQEELYVILSGSGRMNLAGEVVEVAALDAVRVPGETMRAFEAGPDGLELIAFGAPRLQSSDAEMAPGWWGG